jgi:hypothetical protein
MYEEAFLRFACQRVRLNRLILRSVYSVVVDMPLSRVPHPEMLAALASPEAMGASLARLRDGTSRSWQMREDQRQRGGEQHPLSDGTLACAVALFERCEALAWLDEMRAWEAASRFADSPPARDGPGARNQALARAVSRFLTENLAVPDTAALNQETVARAEQGSLASALDPPRPPSSADYAKAAAKQGFSPERWALKRLARHYEEELRRFGGGEAFPSIASASATKEQKKAARRLREDQVASAMAATELEPHVESMIRAAAAKSALERARRWTQGPPGEPALATVLASVSAAMADAHAVSVAALVDQTAVERGGLLDEASSLRSFRAWRELAARTFFDVYLPGVQQLRGDPSKAKKKNKGEPPEVREVESFASGELVSKQLRQVENAAYSALLTRVLSDCRAAVASMRTLLEGARSEFRAKARQNLSGLRELASLDREERAGLDAALEGSSLAPWLGGVGARFAGEFVANCALPLVLHLAPNDKVRAVAGLISDELEHPDSLASVDVDEEKKKTKDRAFSLGLLLETLDELDAAAPTTEKDEARFAQSALKAVDALQENLARWFRADQDEALAAEGYLKAAYAEHRKLAPVDLSLDYMQLVKAHISSSMSREAEPEE